MILGLCLILATATICTIAANSSRNGTTMTVATTGHSVAAPRTSPAPRAPRTPRPSQVRPQAKRRGLSQRAAQLPVRPELATPLDVEFLLSQTLDPDDADRCVTTGVESGLSAPTMWRFGARYGGDKLALAIEAKTSERTMLWHLESGTVPDWGPMSLFAVLDGEEPLGAVPLGEVIEIDVVPTQRTAPTDVEERGARVLHLAAEPIDLSQFDELPPITSPGLSIR